MSHSHRALTTTTSMPTCPRCNYKTNQFTLFIKHCNRKKTCQVVENGQDVNLIELAAVLVQEKQDKKKHVCDVCHKRYTTKATLNVHKRKLHPQQQQQQTTIIEDQTEQDKEDGIVFGEEDLMIYLDDHNTIMKSLLQDASMDIEKIYKTLIATIFKDKSIRIKNGTFSTFTDKGWVASDMKKSIGSAKQRVNMIMQNPLTMEDEEIDQLRNIIGIDKFTALEDWTYRMDLCDQDQEFDETTNAMFLNILVAYL